MKHAKHILGPLLKPLTITTRPIKLREAYRGLRNLGVGPASAAFVAVVWVLVGVEVDIEPEAELTQQ